MKVVNIVSYVNDPTLVAAVRPEHRAYMATLSEHGQLAAAGPFQENTGGLFVYEVRSLAEAESVFAKDPYFTRGVISSYRLQVWNLAGATSAFFDFSFERANA
jgi:uncharacterized protein YciI